MTATMGGRLLTPGEVAALFRVDPKTVTRWATAGRITPVPGWITWVTGPAKVKGFLKVFVPAFALLFGQLTQEVGVVVRGERGTARGRRHPDPLAGERPPQEQGDDQRADRREQSEHAGSFRMGPPRLTGPAV